ncbi:MAG: branched-chain amino acid transport system ATP-binding protein, partial [Pseudonocardiales bacterium]|nr:branched-chain amino acid transport system ATP-binding protein [Pseudonocardiales bacterium]
MALLEATGVTVKFGGVTAVDDASIAADEGTITGLIGPNGAGKTTIFDIISGHLPTQRGRIVLGERDISDWSPERRAAAGL